MHLIKFCWRQIDWTCCIFVLSKHSSVKKPTVLKVPATTVSWGAFYCAWCLTPSLLLQSPPGWLPNLKIGQLRFPDVHRYLATHIARCCNQTTVTDRCRDFATKIAICRNQATEVSRCRDLAPEMARCRDFATKIARCRNWATGLWQLRLPDEEIWQLRLPDVQIG